MLIAYWVGPIPPAAIAHALQKSFKDDPGGAMVAAVIIVVALVLWNSRDKILAWLGNAGSVSSAVGVASQATWLTLYSQQREQGRTEEQSIRFVLDFLRRREPFDGISDEVAGLLASRLARLPSPKKFTQFLFEVERHRNPRLLTPAAAKDFVNAYREQAGMGPI